MPPKLTLLKLGPAETLKFKKTATTTTNNQPTETLTLTSTSGSNVAFKVKTTAPKSYLVRPSSGTLGPHKTIEVQIIYQSASAQGDNAASHRFLVQAVVVQSAEALSRDEWNEYPKDQIQEGKLNVQHEDQDLGPAGNAPTYTAKADAGRPAGVDGGSESTGDLKVKYDELVQYTLMLEKEKKKLEHDKENSRSKAGTNGGDGGYTLTHMIIVAIVAALAAYAMRFLGSTPAKTAVTATPATPDVTTRKVTDPHDCEADRENWMAWSEDKSNWCCKNKGIGCKDKEASKSKKEKKKERPKEEEEKFHQADMNNEL